MIKRQISIYFLIIVLLTCGCIGPGPNSYETDDLPLGSEAFDKDFQPRDQ